MTDLRQRSTPPTVDAPRSGSSDDAQTFRPSSRRRNRIAAGVALAAAAIAGNLFVYSGLDDDESVLQVVRDVPAGERITPDMLRTVDVRVDDSVAVVPATQIDAIVGSVAKVRLVSGALVTSPSLQSEPLVSVGTSVVAIQLDEGAIPVGLRERVPVDIVIPADPNLANEAPLSDLVIAARVVALPIAPSAAIGTVSLSVEVAAIDAATLAAANDVRIVLVEPQPDPAHLEPGHLEPGQIEPGQIDPDGGA
jgi:hypothetical protein